MKHYNLAIAIAVALSSSLAIAEPHEFQRQIGSSELDPSIWEGPELMEKKVQPSNFKDSRTAMYESANVDGDAPFHVVGNIEPSGPTRISLYEVYRDSPEGTAYRDYHERFPADTDWAAVAQQYKNRGGNV